MRSKGVLAVMALPCVMVIGSCARRLRAESVAGYLAGYPCALAGDLDTQATRDGRALVPAKHARRAGQDDSRYERDEHREQRQRRRSHAPDVCG